LKAVYVSNSSPVARGFADQGSSGAIGIPVFSVANLRNPRCCILEAESGGKKLAEFIVGNT